VHATEMTVESYGVTDRGHRRETNQDQFLIADLGPEGLRVKQTSLDDAEPVKGIGSTDQNVLAVADGLGGHEGGERASALALRSLIRTLSEAAPRDESSIRDGLRKALEAGEKEVTTAATRGEPRMGTTLTVACLRWPQLHLAHVGDSRCYLLRGSRLEQLTEDHTVANEMVRNGVIEEERAESTKWQHVLHKAVGGGSPMGEPQLRSVELRGGDMLLLCTDGLTKHLDDEAIGDRLIAVRGPEAAAHHLVNMALQDGGHDNVTAVVARVETGHDRRHSPGRHPILAGGGGGGPLP